MRCLPVWCDPLRGVFCPRLGRRWAALLYALAWPLLYLGAFLLSENVAVPLWIASVWLLVCRPARVRYLAASGLLLAVACALRPAFLFPSLVSIVYVLRVTGVSLHAASWPRPVTFACSLRPCLPFLAPFALFLLLVCHQNAVVSGGRVSGLGANGGVNLLYGQSGARMIRCTFDAQGTRWVYLVYGPDAPNRAAGEADMSNRIETRVPFYEQSYYVRYALAYMVRPSTWARDVGHLRFLLAGHMYPDTPAAYDNTDGLWKWLAGLSLALTFAGLPVYLLTGERASAGLWWLLWGFLAVTAVQSLLFCTDAVTRCRCIGLGLCRFRRFCRECLLWKGWLLCVDLKRLFCGVVVRVSSGAARLLLLPLLPVPL